MKSVKHRIMVICWDIHTGENIQLNTFLPSSFIVKSVYRSLAYSTPYTVNKCEHIYLGGGWSLYSEVQVEHVGRGGCK